MTRLNRRKKKLDRPPRRREVGCRTNIHLDKGKERSRVKREREE